MEKDKIKNELMAKIDIGRRKIKFEEIAIKMIALAPNSQAGFKNDLKSDVDELRKARIGGVALASSPPTAEQAMSGIRGRVSNAIEEMKATVAFRKQKLKEQDDFIDALNDAVKTMNATKAGQVKKTVEFVARNQSRLKFPANFREFFTIASEGYKPAIIKLKDIAKGFPEIVPAVARAEELNNTLPNFKIEIKSDGFIEEISESLGRIGTIEKKLEDVQVTHAENLKANCILLIRDRKNELNIVREGLKACDKIEDSLEKALRSL